ncbi:hypothetical protein [Variovorax sp. dw_954]|uniref:hypothetical protein n=1 Tax=Variovorax sp. dw_954 TaxID=2720078 RepID=UPI001BD30902|nr:hypothetical protein [Variovorax sp. dw_954]
MRTGFKAGAAFASSVVVGGLLALLLGGGAFAWYLGRFDGPGMSAAHAGGVGAVLAMLASPPLLVAMLLMLYVPLYLMIGVKQGHARALQQVVRAHGETLSQRLASAIAGRIEAMPRTYGALQRVPEWLTVETLSRQLAPVLGESKALSRAIGFVLARLPLSDMVAHWQQTQGEFGAAAAGAEDPALRTMLNQRIGDALQDAATPSRTIWWIAVAAHAALAAVGFYLTR